MKYIRHEHILSADVYLRPFLPSAETPTIETDATASPNKRQWERETVMLLLRHVFGDDVQLVHDDQGKPSVVGYDGYISISHSRYTAALAVSEDAPIGIDIEGVSERLQRVSDKILTHAEYNELESFPEHLHLNILTQCWCAKEAIYKIEGDQVGALAQKVRVSPLSLIRPKRQAYTLARYYDLSHITLFDELPDGSPIEEVCMVAMRTHDVNTYLHEMKEQNKPCLAVLLDPDKTDHEALQRLRDFCQNRLPDLILVGGSFMHEQGKIEDYVRDVRDIFYPVPIVMFPGDISQAATNADAIFFLSVVSGREPESLIGQQVKAARHIKDANIETLPLAYILIDGGRESAVERKTGTKGIPQTDKDTIVNTAIAAEMLGMHYAYLEAGSGALKVADTHIIHAVRRATDQYLIVGGGIRMPEQMREAHRAGADMVVIGNYFEQHPEEIQKFVF